ncbi:hypothetical protein FQR65_LT00471 [Abscondita terminalis]|nr:hypothetical protein FQR65_LT00471 [Abscondita terminalis]
MFLLLLVLTITIINAESKQIPSEIKKTWHDLTDKHEKVCLDESKTKSEYIKMMVEEAQVTNDKSFGCYLNCVFRKLGIIMTDGEFDVKSILSKASYMTPELTNKCVDESKKDSDACQKSLTAANCTVSGLSVN